MRHLNGIGLAIGLAAAVFFAATWGYLRLLKVPVVNGGASSLPANGGALFHNTSVIYPVAALAGTALLAGIFVAWRRISPLAAGLPGAVMIAWTVVYAFSTSRAVHYIPLRGDTFGTGFEALLMNGLLAAGGVLLVIPMLIPSRWQSSAVVTEEVVTTDPVTDREEVVEEKVPVAAGASPSSRWSLPWSRTAADRADDDD